MMADREREREREHRRSPSPDQRGPCVDSHGNCCDPLQQPAGQTSQLITSNKPRSRIRPTSASISRNNKRDRQALAHSASARRVKPEDKEEHVTTLTDSPLKTKLAVVQERRVNGVLKDALALFHLASQETCKIDTATSQLKQIIGNFALLVDKQQQKKHFQMQQQLQREEALSANGFLDQPEFEFSAKLAERVQLELETMIDTLRASHAVLENSNLRIKKALSSSRKQCGLFQKRIGTKYLNDLVANECNPTARACSVRKHHPPNGVVGVSQTNTCSHDRLPVAQNAGTSPIFSTNRIPLRQILMPKDSVDNVVQPELFESVMQRLGLMSKPQLDRNDVFQFVQEMLIFCIAKNQTLTFATKNFHRQNVQQYAVKVVSLLLQHQSATPSPSPPQHYKNQNLPHTSLRIPPSSATECDHLGSTAVTPNDALLYQEVFRGLLCDEPFVFDQVLQKVLIPDSVESSFSNWNHMTFNATPSNNKCSNSSKNGTEILHEIQSITTAEQTLTMAKLLNDLADMEAHAHHRKMMSYPQAKNVTFNRAYINTTKQITQKETKLLQKR